MNPTAEKILNKHFSDVIIARGESYFHRGAVRRVNVESNFVSAVVHGSQNYHLFINFDDDFDFLNISCSCPYFRSDNCKHLAALVYHLSANGFFGDDKDDEPRFSINAIDERKKRKEKDLLYKKNILEEKLSPLVDNVQKKSSKKTNVNYELDYGIEFGYSAAGLFIVRKRLRKDGSVASLSKARSINLNSFEFSDMREKLLAEYLTRNLTYVFFESYTSTNENINTQSIYNEILTFLGGRRIYLVSRYDEYSPLNVLTEKAESRLVIGEEKTGELTIELEILLGGEKTVLTDTNTALNSPLWIRSGDKIFRVKNLSFEQWNFFKERDFKIKISKIYLNIFEKDFLPKIASKLPIVSDKYRVENVSVNPVKKIFLEEEKSRLFIKIKFGYDIFDFAYAPDEKFTSAFNDGKILTFQRDKEFEEQAVEEIKNLYVKNIEPGVYEPRKDPIDFLIKNLAYLKEKEFEIYGESELDKFKVNVSKPKVAFNVSSGIDWFDVTAEVDFDGAVVPFSELVAAIKSKKKYLKLSDGSAGVLPEEWTEKFKRTLAFGEAQEEGVRFSKLQALALETILEEADEFQTDENFAEQVKKLKSFDEIKRQSVPRAFKGKLRNYQKAGVNWLYFLNEYSFGGILADDMGLGKTIQTIVLLLKEQRKNKNYTNLIIAPTSVVFNWNDEIAKFAPSLKTLNHTGMQREKNDISIFESYDVVLTSYGAALRDVKVLKDFRFHYIILDESQKIKNPFSKTGRATRQLQSDFRLCLTGTPIENNLSELWSQMAFLNPGLLGSYKHFDESFIKPIAKRNDADAIKLLKKTVYPFILRRTKEKVATDLPEKTETIHYCEMEHRQEKIYNFWKDSIRAEILMEIQKKGLKKSGFKVLEGLLRLRQICNHPVLVQNDYKGKASKFEEFKTMLSKVVAEGHKALVFSQFVKMLEIMRSYLDENGIEYEYLTGATRKREERVKNFKNNGKVKVFLISLKAGGFGLNLTEADYVFHYDPWWNPAVETQATDRTHRIGQDKNVFVYKFITKNSVEEKILSLQEKKRNLVKEIISSETGLLKNLTQKDIEILFE